MANFDFACIYDFPAPHLADPEGHGLICMGGDLAPSTLLSAYSQGLFPWFSKDEPICWWSPEPRCIIYPEQYKPSKSLLRTMKKHDYSITVNRAFEQVIRSCAMPRSYSNETWISEDIIHAYSALFHAGYGYSIEVWQKEDLVGGLYGICLGQGCFGESMFSRATDVSKMAFYTLMLIGQAQQLPWIDCQLVNEHLIRLGAVVVSRDNYLKSLEKVISKPQIDWNSYQNSVFSSKTLAIMQKI